VANAQKKFDAVVVGSGPNGLCAAIRLLQAGKRVQVVERYATPGGGLRTEELTLPGFWHDRCASVLPMAVASRFLQSLPLEEHGFSWVQPPLPFGHPLDDGTAVVCHRSVEETAANLDDVDADTYRKMFTFLDENFDAIVKDGMAPLGIPDSPLVLSRFGLSAMRSAEGLANAKFKGERAKALFAGVAAHSVLPLDTAFSAAIGLMLHTAGHTYGWPFPKGGAVSLSNALVGIIEDLGGEVVCDVDVDDVNALDTDGPVLFDTSVHTLIRCCGEQLTPQYRRRLEKFVYGPGVFKVDWALKAPIPWTAQELLQTATVHVGGTLDELAASEAAAWPTPPEKGGPDVPEIFDKPYVLVVQPSLFDDERAPGEQHTAWAYVHVPNGDSRDRTDIIEAQIERYAPGFKDVILERFTTSADDIFKYNPNYVGGDIAGGAASWDQLFSRPVAKPSPYCTSHPRFFLCSSSTPPGGGVHGMCGFFAAEAVLKRWS